MYTRQLARHLPIPVVKLGSPCNSCDIREVSLCGALADEELERLRQMVATVHCEPGQAAFHEGDPAESVFNVVSGTMKLYKLLPDGRRLITGFLFPGDFLGIALHDTYAYTAEAVELAHLCRFPRRRLILLMEEIPLLEHRMLGHAADELVAAQDQMLLLGRKTAKERIASFLLMLAERAARLGQRENPIRVPMGRADMADYLGLTTETVSRTLTQLRNSGIIATKDRGRIEVKAREALVALRESG